MRIERNLRLIELFTILANTLFLIPVLLPYYSDVIGLGYREFLLGEAAFAVSIVLFDVPTGWISDVWRRKHTLALGMVLDIIGWCILLKAHHLWQASLAQAVLGVGYSLLSGTNTALIYDSLLSVSREGEYRRYEGKRLAVSLYAVAGASITGGFLYGVNPYLPLIVTMITSLIGIFVALAMDEPERHKRIGQKHPLADIYATMVYALHGHTEIGFLILFAAVMFCSTKLIMWSQQPYYTALHFPSAAFGLLMAVGYCLGGASSHIAHRFDGKVETFRALIIACGVAFLVCIGAALYMGVSGVILLMIGGSCIFGTTSPRVNEYINNRVGSERRATILSTLSFMSSLLFVPMSMVVGWASDYGGVQMSLYAIALWLCVAGACLAGWTFWRRTTAE